MKYILFINYKIKRHSIENILNGILIALCSYTCGEHSIAYRDIEGKEQFHHYKDTLCCSFVTTSSPFPSANIANDLRPLICSLYP